MPRIVTAIWKWIRLNEKQLRIIFTLAAATYVAVEYYDAKRDDKIEHSLTYIERFQAEDVVSARNVVNKFWNLSADDTVISSLGQDQFGVSDAPFGKEGRLEEENSIYKLHVFYGDLAVCTSSTCGKAYQMANRPDMGCFGRGLRAGDADPADSRSQGLE